MEAGISLRYVFSSDNSIIRIAIRAEKNSFTYTFRHYNFLFGPDSSDITIPYFRFDFHPPMPHYPHCHLKGYGKDQEKGTDHLTSKQVEPWVGSDVYKFLDNVEEFRRTKIIPIKRKLP